MNINITKVMGILIVLYLCNPIRLFAQTSLNAQAVSSSQSTEQEVDDLELELFLASDQIIGGVNDNDRVTDQESIFLDRYFSNDLDLTASTSDEQVDSLQMIWNEAGVATESSGQFVVSAIENGYSVQAALEFSISEDLPSEIVLAEAVDSGIEVAELVNAINVLSGPAKNELQTNLFWVLVKSGVSAREAEQTVFGENREG